MRRRFGQRTVPSTFAQGLRKLGRSGKKQAGRDRAAGDGSGDPALLYACAKKEEEELRRPP
jgi:hypothetical protein